MWAVSVTADGGTAVSGSQDNTLRVWDLLTGTCTATLSGHTRTVNAVSVTADGRTAVSGSYDGSVRVWNLTDGACKNLINSIGVVRSTFVTPDGQSAFSMSDDMKLRTWDLPTGICTARPNGHKGVVLCMSVTPNGRTAISGSYDGTLRVWDRSTRTCTATLQSASGVDSVSASADGRIAVSSNQNEGGLRVWDLAAGTCTLFGKHDGVLSVSVSPDGRTAVSGSHDGTLRVRDLLIATDNPLPGVPAVRAPAFDVLWEKNSDNADWWAGAGLTAEDLAAVLPERKQAGLNPICLDRYQEQDGRPRYTGVWVADPTPCDVHLELEERAVAGALGWGNDRDDDNKRPVWLSRCWSGQLGPGQPQADAKVILIARDAGGTPDGEYLTGLKSSSLYWLDRAPSRSGLRIAHILPGPGIDQYSAAYVRDGLPIRYRTRLSDRMTRSLNGMQFLSLHAFPRVGFAPPPIRCGVYRQDGDGSPSTAPAWAHYPLASFEREMERRRSAGFWPVFVSAVPTTLLPNE